MKFNYRFANLLGSVYHKGNLLFSSDGNSVFSPVGNRVTVFDLKNNKSETLPVESQKNITSLALSPDGRLLIAINEDGEAVLISMQSRSVLNYYNFHRPVHAISFSPDGKRFAVTKENTLMMFHAPGRTKEFNPFVLEKTFFNAYDETVCIDWTSDSRAFCVGCKDMNTRVYGSQKFRNLICYAMSGHSDIIMGAFFELNSLDLYTVSRNCQLCVWASDTDLDGLVPWQEEEASDEDSEEEEGQQQKKQEKEKSTDNADKVLYKKRAKYSYNEARGKGAEAATVTAVTFHKPTHILVTGFQDGAFFLHEMPDFNLIHSLSISDQKIMTISMNKTGDWLALGCSGLGQLLVWEWQSESYILKQQGHFHGMTCLQYSPDGQYMATGGDDAKVKVWNTVSGFCFVTFADHLGSITGVTFNQNGQVVLSSSLDGTVRAYDLNRYRNFRTFTSPRPVQFSCLALDHSGEIVCAGGKDTFEIFVWSMQTGRLLEILAGHIGPISCLSFSPSDTTLASGSWDKTVRLWTVFESRGSKETLTLLSDVLAVSFRPDGQELAIACLNAQVSFWDVRTTTQTGSIEGRHDIGYTRKETDKVQAKKASAAKAFNTLCYTADGTCILAAGRSKNVCIYSVKDQLLVKKFEITCNLSFDGMEELLDRRKMTEWGSLALVDAGQGDDDDGKSISLPGVKKGDMSSRHWKPEVRVSCVRFSPTGRAWAATTTEGLLVYSLDHNLVFDPFELEMDITPVSVKQCLTTGQYRTAVMLAFRLNEQPLIQEVVETLPVSQVEFLCQNLPEVYVDKMLHFVAAQLENSAHIEYYMLWAQKLLVFHGPKLKQKSQSIMGVLRTLQKNLTRKYEDIGKLCDHNKYSMQYLISLSNSKRKHQSETDNGTGQELQHAEMDNESANSSDDDDWRKGIQTVDDSDEEILMTR